MIDYIFINYKTSNTRINIVYFFSVIIYKDQWMQDCILEQKEYAVIL